MVDNKDNMKNLVYKYFAGTSTNEEEQKIFDYINANDDNEQQFREWESEWEEHSEVAPSTEEAWQKLENSMMDIDSKAEETPVRNRWNIAMRWTRRVAASIIFIVVGALAAYYYMSSEPEQYYVSTTPIGSKSCVNLPDGTKVWLNAGSRLKYSTRFNESNRKVELQGEAYFEVTKHDGNIFTVSTEGYNVVVKGTKFDVRAYSDEPMVSTTLFEGKVDINQNEEAKLSLKPGETAIYNKVSKDLSKCVGCASGIGWINGNIEFDNITFNQLALILNRTFDVNIHTDSPTIGNMRLSVSLHNNETVDDVVEAIRLLGNVKITKRGKDIFVH